MCILSSTIKGEVKETLFKKNKKPNTFKPPLLQLSELNWNHLCCFTSK
jgi:hypothetical protein